MACVMLQAHIGVSPCKKLTALGRTVVCSIVVARTFVLVLVPTVSEISLGSYLDPVRNLDISSTTKVHEFCLKSWDKTTW